jgi:hypothetical protein
MAEVKITITDNPDGSVKIEATPNFMTMKKMDDSGHDLTPAHVYALRLLNAAREFSGKCKRAEDQKRSGLWLPNTVVGRA